MTQDLVDYTKVHIYFHYEDELSEKIASQVYLKVQEDGRFLPALEKEIEDLVKTNNEVTLVLSEAVYSREIFRTFFFYANKIGLDLTPILFEAFKENDLKTIATDKYSQFAKTCLENGGITEEHIRNFWDRVFSELNLSTRLSMAKIVATNTSSVLNVQAIYRWVLSHHPELQDQNNVSDLAGIVRTLANFGGTIQGVKELIKKYLNDKGLVNEKSL